MKITEILKENGFGEFVAINKNLEYKNEKYNVFVYDRLDYIENIKESILNEIPYLSNELLKKHLPENLKMDYILDTNKELAKYDHTIISKHIVDMDTFLIDAMYNSTIDYQEHSELLHPNSKILYKMEENNYDIDKVIIVSEL